MYSAGEDFLRGLLQTDPLKRMNMADACVHRWLASQVEQDMNIPNVPAPLHNPEVPISAETPTAMDDVQPAPLASSQPTPFRRIESYSSVPGLQHGREPDPPLPSDIPQDAPTPPADIIEEDPPTRLTKRTASRAFSSSSSLDAVEVAPVAASGSIPRTALPAGAAESDGARETAGRKPPTKRARVEAIGPSSSEDS